MKTLYFVTLLSFLFVFTSCKKEEEVVPDHSHFEGNFLCDVDDNYSHMGSNNKEYDRVVRCWIENDSLKVLNSTFAIESEDQTVFQINHMTGGTGHTKVTFSSDYNSISIHHTWMSALSGPDVNKTYNGTKTILPETKDPHPCLDELEGTYALDVSYRNGYDSIDTQYILNTPVTMYSNIVEIDNDQFYFGPFHSYFHQTTYSTWDGVKTERSIEWHSNSLDINYETITPLSPVLYDTVQYIISGTK